MDGVIKQKDDIVGSQGVKRILVEWAQEGRSCECWKKMFSKLNFSLFYLF